MTLPAIFRRRSRELPALDIPFPIDDFDPIVTLPLVPVLERVVVPPAAPPLPHRLTELSAAKRGIPLLALYLAKDDMQDLAEKLEGLARQAEAWESMAETRDLYRRVAVAARASLGGST